LDLDQQHVEHRRVLSLVGRRTGENEPGANEVGAAAALCSRLGGAPFPSVNKRKRLAAFVGDQSLIATRGIGYRFFLNCELK
jgi:hypothetical protein